MKDTNYCTIELRKSIKSGSDVTDVAVLERLQDYLVETTEIYLHAYEKKDLETLRNVLDEQRHMRKELTKDLRESQYQAVIISTKLVQTYNIFNKLLQNENEKNDFEYDMKIIEHSHKHVKEVLQYLYKHMHVQHKELMEKLDIKASTLTDLMNVLDKVECVEKLNCGKYTFYNLTNEGRHYIRNQIEGIDDEVIVDQERFKIEAQCVVAGKENSFLSEAQKNYNKTHIQKQFFTNRSKINDKWKWEKENLYEWVQNEE